MMTKLSLGLTPYEEDCVQVRSGQDYLPAMRKEAQRFIAGIRKHFAPALETVSGIDFRVKSHGHDFGSYLDVEVVFDAGDPHEAAVAYAIEDHLPGTWEELENEVSDWRPEPATA